jgi:uncharacterized membrane protein YeaQ/YmgE (transglycosylase-associated protein family)
MKSFTDKIVPIQRYFMPILLAFATLGSLLNQASFAADEPGVAQKAQNAVREEASAAVEKAKSLWTQIDEARLKNRTPDEIVAFVIMGVLVAAVTTMFTSLQSTRAGLLGRLLLGLAGAFIGGVIVRMRNIDFGWGPVLIRYEELLFSFVGAFLIMLLPTIIKWRLGKRALKR